MFVLGFVLAGLGIYAFVLGGIWLLVKAFQQSAGWGVVSLFIPLANVIFGLKYWSAAGRPLLIHAAGVFAFLGGGVLLSMNLAARAHGAAQNGQLLLEGNFAPPAIETSEGAPR